MTTINSISGYNPVSKSVVDLDGNTSNIIGWTFRCKKGSDMVPVMDIRSAMRVVGLDESQAKDVKKDNAMRKTMSDMKKGKVINELPSDKDSKIMKFQFDKKIVEELSGEMQLRFEKIESLTFDLSSGVIDCKDAVIREFAYQRLGLRMVSYDKQQFTNFVNKVIESNMNRKIVRIDDGWYFFDNKAEAQLKKVVQMIKMCDPKAQIILMPHVKTAENVDLAVEATYETYLNAIEDVQKRLECHKAREIDERLKKIEEIKIDNDGVLSERVIKNAIEELDILSSQASLSLIQLEAQGDLLKDAVERVKSFIKENKGKVELTEEQKKDLNLAKYSLEKGIPKESVAVILAGSGLTLEDIDRL